MPYLVAACILVGAISLLNLLLTFGVIRRLREHTDLLARRQVGDPALTVGTTVADFTARTVDGQAISRDRLAGTTLVGFFSPHCGACAEQLPQFVDRAAARPGGREQVLAVLVGDESDVRVQRDQLTPLANVVLEAAGGPVAAAFSVRGFPAFALVDSAGTVRASGYTLDSVHEQIPA